MRRDWLDHPRDRFDGFSVYWGKGSRRQERGQDRFAEMLIE